MNLIDRALAQGDSLTADDLLQAMADLYKEPQVWQELAQYPQYIQDIAYIVDYDTQVQMEGLDAFVTGPHAEQYEQTWQALMNCGAVDEARILERVKSLADSDLACEDSAADDEIAVLCRKIALYQDYDAFWDLVRAYIERSWKR